MKILVIAPPHIPVPPKSGSYGGVERAIHELAEEFAKDNTVTVLAREESQLQNAHLIPFTPWDNVEENFANFVFDQLFQLLHDIDLVNIHYPSLTILRRLPALPTVLSLHYTPSSETQKELARHAHLLCQSHAHSKQLEVESSYVLQGIDPTHIPHSAVTRTRYRRSIITPLLKDLKRDYLCMLSRIDQRKGQKSAIEIAQKSGMPLILVGQPYIDDPKAQQSSREYYEQEIKPRVDNESVFHLPRVSEQEKYEILMLAKASVFPTGFEDQEWKEPFGRVIAESLHTGTPVISYDSGAASEQIIHGKNGFLFSTLEEAAQHVLSLDQIDRTFCFTDARKRLSLERYARETLEYFKSIT